MNRDRPGNLWGWLRKKLWAPETPPGWTGAPNKYVHTKLRHGGMAKEASVHTGGGGSCLPACAPILRFAAPFSPLEQFSNGLPVSRLERSPSSDIRKMGNPTFKGILKVGPKKRQPRGERPGMNHRTRPEYGKPGATKGGLGCLRQTPTPGGPPYP